MCSHLGTCPRSRSGSRCASATWAACRPYPSGPDNPGCFQNTPWLWGYWPVRKPAREGQHSGGEANPEVKRVPRSLMPSTTFGITARRSEAASWSSVVITTKFGRSALVTGLLGRAARSGTDEPRGDRGRAAERRQRGASVRRRRSLAGGIAPRTAARRPEGAPPCGDEGGVPSRGGSDRAVQARYMRYRRGLHGGCVLVSRRDRHRLGSSHGWA